MKPRETSVRVLIDAAQKGMMTVVEGTTAVEVLSAYFTMARNAVSVGKELGIATADLRCYVQQIMLECDDPKGRVM